MRAVDIMAVAAEDVGEFIASVRVKHAEHADSQCAKPATGMAKARCWRLVASSQDQIEFRWQLGLDRLQLAQDALIHVDVSRGPARPDLHAGVNTVHQRQQIQMSHLWFDAVNGQ
ncbi:hypothetical protein WT03_24830 [Burkholderia stagnalis]|nr:hypothetical protein WT03_24830 [Burkholderia stagnalis]